MTSADRTLPGSNPNDPKAIKKRFGCGMGCLIIIGLAVAITVILYIVGTVRGSKPYDPNWSGEAISQCENLVKENLKAPATAVFNDTNASGNGTWTVTGTVDSENSFGATLRSSFQCTIVIKDGRSSNRLDYLK